METQIDIEQLQQSIGSWSRELGFQQVGFAGTDLSDAEEDLQAWLSAGFNGEMSYMSRHGSKRSRPAELIPGTVSIISVRMNYWTGADETAWKVLDSGELAYVARYALGRDYHKVLRRRLQRLAARIEARVGEFGYRVFTDSAPVLEKPLARNAGLGWIGKHTNLINRRAGSWFFLGEIYTDLPLQPSEAESEHCGSCRACLDACPTGAIVAPFRLDARRCISYLTIELKGAIPEDLRKPIGNRIFGCDDCQLVCPWNKFARPSAEGDFAPRHNLDTPRLAKLFAWTEETFQRKTEGSAIRRIGISRWRRNLAVALGNAPSTQEVLDALHSREHDPSPLVREHVTWALAQHRARHSAKSQSGSN